MGAIFQNFAGIFSDFHMSASRTVKLRTFSVVEAMSHSERKSCERVTLELHSEAKQLMEGRAKRFPRQDAR